jgi:hypothetical protein
MNTRKYKYGLLHNLFTRTSIRIGVRSNKYSVINILCIYNQNARICSRRGKCSTLNLLAEEAPV